MEENCPKTCNFCTFNDQDVQDPVEDTLSREDSLITVDDPASSDAVCEDKIGPTCVSWHRYCNSNNPTIKKYTRENCRRSCGLCTSKNEVEVIS